MTTASYKERYQRSVSIAEECLSARLQEYLPASEQISQAARYSLLGGGKRVRAVLTISCCEVCGGAPESAADYAAALEMLHCYSLIHDDLPCMDNDDYRRGRLSCHKKYPEHIALLAADALVTAAFEVIANAPRSAESRVSAAKALARAGGARGMLLGQELDKRYERNVPTPEQLYELHRNKTGALICAASELGCAAAGASESQTAALRKYAQELGLVFQIVDDILDVTSDAATLGKPVGSDTVNGKTTFITLFGLDAARKMAAEHTQKACDALIGLPQTEFLAEMAQRLLNRKK
jgi:geranylgeranyl pyrophosphate synthase